MFLGLTTIATLTLNLDEGQPDAEVLNKMKNLGAYMKFQAFRTLGS